MSDTEEPGPDAPEGQSSVPPDDGKRTPDEWAKEFFPPGERLPNPDAFKHGAAEALHGWKVHEHHAGAPMRLSRDDYQAAIDAALTVVDGRTYVPHPAALSEHHKVGR